MAMNDRVHIMREAIIKITQMLAGKTIQVTQRGIQAYVKSNAKGVPILVNLPYIPDNATNELIDAIQGFLDHEVAHILFTDFEKMAEAGRAGIHGMVNVLEDSRIERKMAERFQGSGDNLQRTGEFFLKKFTIPKLQEAIEEGDNEKVVGLLMVPLIRGMAGQRVWHDFMKTHMPHIQEQFDKIKDLAGEIESLDSTADCLGLATKIKKRLDKASDPSMGGGGGSKGKAPPMPKPAGDPDEEEGEPAPAPPSGDPDDEEGDVSVGDENEEDSEPVESDSTKREAPGGEEQDISMSSGMSFKDIDKNMAVDFDDALSSIITNDAADSAGESDYLIYSKDFDVVEPLEVGSGYKDDYMKNMVDDVEHMVGPLQKDLERAISARSLSQWTPGQRSGRLNSSALSRLAVGDARVFRKKHEVTSKDVAVELVVDMSGSMSGTKITTASRAAYALASTLERIGIPCEVICFTTGRAAFDDFGHYSAEVAKIGRNYSRNEALYMPILKKFDERMLPNIKQRFAWLPHCGDLRNNVDGESIEVAARRLMTRREAGKVLMVLSDGAPHAAGSTSELSAHLKKTIKEIAKRGVNVLGIGIESDEVRKYYPKALVIHNVSELPGVVMKELRALLIK
jgi:cobaltochelatase CobT